MPLSTLLSWAWIAHTIEVDNAFEAASADRVGRCVRMSLPMWTNGLRLIDEDGIAVDEVRARARRSLQHRRVGAVGLDHGRRRRRCDAETGTEVTEA